MMYDLIIIGGGPAGIAAGVYASRKKLKVLLVTNCFGGQSVIASDIQNFIGFKSISGFDLAKMFEEHLRAQEGIEIQDGILVSRIEKKNDGFVVAGDKGEVFEAKTILLALGRRYRKLNIDGESKFEGKGVFYCSICDAPLMRNKVAAVIGGGNSGFEAALDLLPYAKKIYLLESTDILRADAVSQEKVKNSGKVEIITMVKLQEIFGDEFVKGIKYEDCQKGGVKKLVIDGIFVSIGYQPNTEIVKNLVELNKAGEIVVEHKTQKTSCEGIWAAGDIADGLYHQSNIAIGDAIKAVLNISNYLNKK